ERGIVHRDIKPDNLMLPGGRVDAVKIVDFGLARTPPSDLRLTRTHALLGTPGYMAPEQARGDPNIGAPADAFALGAGSYAALTGRAPFVGPDVLAILMMTVLEEPRRPSATRTDVRRELDDLVMRMLTKAPDRRPASADVREALLRARADRDV